MSEHTKTRILVVDDQEGMRESLSGIFELEGYEVEAFDDGYKAIERVKHASFDIAFLDIKMPGINGVETFLEIKKISPDLVVFMMTAYADQDLIKQALAEGAFAVIYKPFDIENIIKAIGTVQQGAKVLMLDGHKTEPNRVHAELSRKGYKVASVSSGQEVVTYLSRKTPDVIIVHLEKERTEVLETIKTVKSDTKSMNTHVVVILPSDDNGSLSKLAAEAGADIVLREPVPVETVERRIRELIASTRGPAKPSVLVVDDDVSLGKSLGEILTESGYSVELATTGAEALEKVRSCTCQLVLLDIRLPDTSGLELYKEIQKVKPGLGVVMMTAYSKDQLISESIKREEYVCLHKPFDPAEMLEIVKKIARSRK